MAGYVARRLIYMVVTLFVISVVSFVIIRLPPGDILDSLIASLRLAGRKVDYVIMEQLRHQYGLDQPVYVQYVNWMWGVFHGDFGQSFDCQQPCYIPVSRIIVERLPLTILLSIATMLFSWAISFPVGMYSATHEYSAGDYVVTFLGYVGLATPGFMLALILMWIAYVYFGSSVGGLFSPDFINAPWSLARVGDLLSHLWIPALIIGTAGTAGLIRTLRANLLDEVSRPYVVTARAKGVPERILFWKYPLRIAIIPFISTVGWMLPAIISGEVIVAVVLALPTTGPVLLRSLLNQDMYLAGSFVMLLSVLTVIGTAISDILLAWVDPRIRLGAGGR